jgi:hypothetical protein
VAIGSIAGDTNGSVGLEFGVIPAGNVIENKSQYSKSVFVNNKVKDKSIVVPATYCVLQTNDPVTCFVIVP